MVESSLEERLRDHAEAFDGLLSLIPAKFYYGEDTSDQWKKKKQTKEQAAAARRAKLDPDSAKSAKDVMEERAKKRKLEELEQSDIEGLEKELPKQGMKLPGEKRQKKQKTASKDGTTETSAAPSAMNSAIEKPSFKQAESEARRLKQEKRKQKDAQKSRKKTIKTTMTAELLEETISEKDNAHIHATSEVVLQSEGRSTAEDHEQLLDDIIGQFEAEGLENEIGEQSSDKSTSPSPTFDVPPADPSSNTSTSSIIPPAIAPRHIKVPTDPELLRARLTARIEALRAARKADGPNGAPAKNRQELMEARRRKEEQRRAHKKELRAKARAEEDARREAALASARDSPASSMLSPSMHSAEQHSFSFGRVSFADGQRLADDLSAVLSVPKKKGPQDPHTALQASEKKRLRTAGFDDLKRADIEEKDLWLNAKKRAHGERIRDDSSLLKKTLKRKEKAKKKSEKEWDERKDSVAKSQAMKQKKREENLRKRKDEKGGKGKGKSAGAKKGKPKVKSRPGFEGSFGSGRKRK